MSDVTTAPAAPVDTSGMLRPGEAPEVVALVGEGFRLTRQAIEQLVREHGVTAAQFGILRKIEETPGISRAELARQAYVSPQAAQVALTTLESKGLVARKSRSDSHRVVGAVLTAAGQRVVDACRDATTPLAEAFVAPLRPVEQHMLIDLLRRCVEPLQDGRG